VEVEAMINDAEWTEVKLREQKLRAVFERHLGPSDDEETRFYTHAIASLSDDGHFDQFWRSDERERLQRFQGAARDVARALESLPPQVKGIIVDASIDFEAEDSGSNKRDDNYAERLIHWGKFWYFVQQMDRLVDFAAPRVHELIDATPEIGRRSIRAVNVVDYLRKIWAHRMKKPAPEHLNEATPFANFLREAFKALGLKDNARAMMDSWRKYREEHPDS
jgi:hypothetical protein